MKLANPKGLLALILIAAVALTACGGNASSSASGTVPQTFTQPADAIPVVSLSMDDYLGSTVVLYFSFPG